MKKKKFCFIIPSFFYENKGGAEIQCFYIARELIKRNWEVHYIRESSTREIEKEVFKGIILHALPRRRDYLRWANYFKLKKLMSKINADIWYDRATQQVDTYLPQIVRINKSIGGEILWACSHDNIFGMNLKKIISGKAFYKKALISFCQLMFLRALKKTHAVILQTNYQLSLLQNRYKLDGYVIHNAHPVPKAFHTPRKNLILWIGRVKRKKHPERFIELAKALKNKNYSFVLIGSYKEKQCELLIQNTSKYLVNFNYVGELPSTEVHRKLAEAKLLINTSDVEGFSNTFIEAWLRGVPVISYSVDPDGMIEKNDLGKVSGSLQQMVTDVTKFMEDDSSWRHLSENCRTYALKNFDIKRAVDKLEMIIGKIL